MITFRVLKYSTTPRYLNNSEAGKARLLALATEYSSRVFQRQDDVVNLYDDGMNIFNWSAEIEAARKPREAVDNPEERDFGAFFEVGEDGFSHATFDAKAYVRVNKGGKNKTMGPQTKKQKASSKAVDLDWLFQGKGR